MINVKESRGQSETFYNGRFSNDRYSSAAHHAGIRSEDQGAFNVVKDNLNQTYLAQAYNRRSRHAGSHYAKTITAPSNYEVATLSNGLQPTEANSLKNYKAINIGEL